MKVMEVIKRKSYKDKKWLTDVARKVKYNAVRYERQLKTVL